MVLSEIVQENIPSVLTSAVPQEKELNAEVVTTMAAGFLKRIGHKGGLKPKRVSLEGDLYTVEVELKQFSATVKVDTATRQIKEYDVQPKSEESSLSTLSPKTLLTMIIVSSIVNVGLYFAFKIFGL
jgi:hypothetical protein